MPLFSGLRAKLLPLCGVLLLCGSAHAATYTGNSATGYDDQGHCVGIAGNNSFDDPRNWGPACGTGTVPGPGDTANIGGFGVSGTTVSVGTLNFSGGGNLTADSITTDNLNIAGGTVAGRDANASTLRVNSSFGWTQGALTTLQTTLAPTCTTTISHDYDNAGSGSYFKYISNGTVRNQGTLNWSGASIGGGGTLNNSGTFNLLGDGSIGNVTNGESIVLINSGTVTKTGGSGTTGIGAGSFTSNGGTLAAQSGIFSVSQSYSPTTINGATIGAGGGEVELGGAALSGNFAVNGTARLTGTSAGTATFSGPGRLDWQSGGFDGTYIPTSITFAPDFQADMTGAATKQVGGVTNKGLLTWNAAGELSGGMRNEGTFNFLSDGALGGIYSGFGVVNTGTLAKTGGNGVLSIGQSVIDNSGTIDIQSGTLELSNTPNGSGDFLRDGSLIKGAGKLLAFRPVASDGTITVDGTYQWGDETAGVYIIGGTYKGSGHIEWKGGTGSGVTFSPGFAVNISGAVAKSFSGGTPYGSAGDSFNQGTLNWQGGAGISINGTLTNSGTLNFGATGGGFGGTFLNSGVINTFPGGTSGFAGTLRNTGTINLGTPSMPGTLTFYGGDPYNGFVQTGTINANLVGSGDGQFSQITALSDANAASVINLSGTLNISYGNGFTPASSDSFSIVKIQPDRASYNGTFQTVNGLGFSGGKLKINYNPGNVTLSVATLPTLSVDSPSVMEGNSGTTPLPFTFTLSAASTEPVSFKYATGDASAKTGLDYVGKSETVTFAPGETSKVVNISIIGDTTDESDETFGLNLSEASGLTFARVQTLGTITDDDGQPSISISDTKVNEADATNVVATFTLRLSNASSQTIKVNYATQDGTAIAPDDYTKASGTITFAPGEVSKLLPITIRGDKLDEVNETYTVKLSNPVGATISHDTGLGTIFDNDDVPVLSLGTPHVTEGNSGTANLSFEITLSNPSSRVITFLAKTFNAATLPATAGTDYTPLAGQTFTFAPGQSRLFVSIPVKGDLLDEENERVGLQLRSPVNASLGSTAVAGALNTEGTIVDDDAPPTLSIGDISVVEGNNGTTSAIFTVSLAAPSGKEIRVGYATSPGSALAGSDFITQSGVLVFAPGQTTRTISIGVVGDAAVEANETFKVTLSGAVNAPIAHATAVATIVNDDRGAAGVSGGSS